MENNQSEERNWWLWQMYRQVACLVNNPSEVSEAKLRVLISEYCNLHGRKNAEVVDPHERLMDYQ